MLIYFLKWKGDTQNLDSKVIITKNGKKILLSKCAVCSSKKSRLIKEQEAKGLLSDLGLQAPLNKIPLFGDILL